MVNDAIKLSISISNTAVIGNEIGEDAANDVSSPEECFCSWFRDTEFKDGMVVVC